MLYRVLHMNELVHDMTMVYEKDINKAYFNKS